MFLKKSPIRRPKLTLPEVEARALTEAYAQASVILEYGSGGSTVLGAEMPGKRLFSVESDAKWLAQMQQYFAANPPLADVHLHHGDIGPTRDWGHPLDDDDFRLWPNYPTSIWELERFVPPDLALIDGRFRVACFLTVMFLTTKPMKVLIDDYIDRDKYHVVESFAGPPIMHGRMAQFDITPTPIPPAKLGWIVQRFLMPG